MTPTKVPFVFGEPARIEVLLESVVRLVAREPSETFADEGVQRSLSKLSRLGARRTAEATGRRRTPAVAKEVDRWPLR